MTCPVSEIVERPTVGPTSVEVALLIDEANGTVGRTSSESFHTIPGWMTVRKWCANGALGWVEGPNAGVAQVRLIRSVRLLRILVLPNC